MNDLSKKYSELLRDLKEDGRIGLDLSSGNQLSARAAKAIEELLDALEKRDELMDIQVPSELKIFKVPETQFDESVKPEDLRQSILDHCRISSEQNAQMNIINSIQAG